MKMLAHDLEPAVFATLFPAVDVDVMVIDQTKDIHSCMGCFGCWVKTPSSCVIKDDFQRMGALYDRCDEVILVSNCIYGCYSPFIKNIMDRSMTWVLPFFEKRNGEMHHPVRYANRFKLTVHFYDGDLTAAERATAERLVRANAVNIDARAMAINFHENLEALKGALQ